MSIWRFGLGGIFGDWVMTILDLEWFQVELRRREQATGEMKQWWRVCVNNNKQARGTAIEEEKIGRGGQLPALIARRTFDI